MKRDDSDHEEAKEDDLNEQSSNDDVLSNLDRAQRTSTLNTATTSLQQKCKDVAPDEHARDPLGRDAAEGLLGVTTVSCTKDDNTLERHVDRGGEEGGGDKQEDGLDDVGAEGPDVAVGDAATDVANYFH